MSELSKFVRTEYFSVGSAPIVTTKLLHVREGELKIGGRNRPTTSGMAVRTEIDILPRADDDWPVPIRKLIFEGFSSLRAGDYIKVKIPRYRDDGDFFESEWASKINSRGEHHYADREYKEQEEAIEIETLILGAPNHTVRIERSANYSKYFS